VEDVFHYELTVAYLEEGFRFAYSATMAERTARTVLDEGRPRRVDARRNRARILDAAGEVFGEAGLLVPMSEVARRAGVGIATLARNFPTRDALIAETFGPSMTAYADAVEVALQDPDPWHGFCDYVETVCRMQAEVRGFTHVLTTVFPAAEEFEAERGRAYRGFVRLVKAAKTAGRLRPDFSPHDLPVILMANAGVVSATSDTAPTAWRRHVALILQACSATHADPLPTPPPPTQILQALRGPH
jgi:AcrR family transcriptional regulator